MKSLLHRIFDLIPGFYGFIEWVFFWFIKRLQRNSFRVVFLKAFNHALEEQECPLEDMRTVSSEAVLRYFGEEPQENKPELQGFILNCIESLKKDSECKDYKITFLRLQYAFCSGEFFGRDEPNEDGIFAKEELEREGYEVKADELQKLPKNFVDSRKDLKEVRKVHKEKRRDLVKEHSSESIFESKITLEKVAVFLTITSSIYFLISVTYIHLLFGLLGVNPSDFFDIGDYLSSGQDFVFDISISSSLSLLYFVLGRWKGNKLAVEEKLNVPRVPKIQGTSNNPPFSIRVINECL